MKIRTVRANNRKKAFEVRVASRTLPFPYALCEPRPRSGDAPAEIRVDRELAHEGFSYVLASGREGTVHVDQVLEYNKDPDYLRDQLVYRLTLEAQKRVEVSPLSKREIVRRLGTSAAQLYRLLDQTNYSKSIDQLVSLLAVLDCELDVVVRAKSA